MERLRILNYRFVEELPQPQTGTAQTVQNTITEAKKQAAGDQFSVDMLSVLEQRAHLITHYFGLIGDKFQQFAEQWRAEHDQAEAQEQVPFAWRTREPVWNKPNDALRNGVNQLEREYGPLPLVLKTWCNVVGEVNLCGAHPTLSYYAGFNHKSAPTSDPLEVGCPNDYIQFLAKDGDLEGPPYEFEFAADACHKANTSGGGASFIEFPNADFDAPMVSEDWNGMYFVPYLRLCFQWGGFPGLSDNPQAAERAWADLAFLTKDLLPI